MLIGNLLREMSFGASGRLNVGKLSQIGGSGFSKDAAGVEHVSVFATRLHPAFHVLAAYGFVATVAGERDLLSELDTALGLNDHPCATSEP